MIVYCTSKNTGPSWQSDPVHVLYIGTDLKVAEEKVGDFRRYEADFSHYSEFPKSYSALPRDLEWEPISFYMADGWWFSIVWFELEDNDSRSIDPI